MGEAKRRKDGDKIRAVRLNGQLIPVRHDFLWWRWLRRKVRAWRLRRRPGASGG